MGTFILVLFGCGANASAIASAYIAVEHLSYSIGWSLGIYFGIYSCVKTSGGHINPAITLTLAVFNKFPWIKVPIYISAQLIGSFLAAALIFANSHDLIKNFG